MAWFRKELLLVNNPDYSFTTSLEQVSYRIRLYYNEVNEWWAIDLYLSDGTPVVLGQRLSPEYPLFLDYIIPDLTGYFYLLPIGKDQNETKLHPLRIDKYYRLFYYWEEFEE